MTRALNHSALAREPMPRLLVYYFSEEQKRRNREAGQRGNRRGKAAEQRALKIFQDVQPKWVYSVRLATKAEDHQGIDLVCDTKYGPVYIQVKSAEVAARRFKRKMRRSMIATIVVNESKSDGRLHAEATEILSIIKSILEGIRRKRHYDKPARLI